MSEVDVNFSPNFAACSIEALLNVPTQFIFREAQTGDRVRGSTNQKNFIFSKSEASTLLRVSMLASELDAVMSLVYDALDRSQKCKSYRKYIEVANTDTMSKNTTGAVALRALLPILDVHNQTSDMALKHATSADFGISRILNELQACANDLGKFAEQNHNMADQLECYMAAPGQNNTLSSEKRAIAEIEEGIVERVENLSSLATGSPPGDSQNNEQLPADTTFTSMSDLCESLFSGKQPMEAPNANNTSQPEGGLFTESQVICAEALQSLHGAPEK